MVRRSARNAAKVSYKDSSDSEDIESEVEDVYEEKAPTTKRATKRKTTKKSGQPTKKQKKSSTKSLQQLEDDLEENYLYKSLANNDANIQNIALDWIEEYEEDVVGEKYDAITALINLILRSCGSLHLFQPHDLSNLESSSDTVAEIAIAFGNQPFHKYPFKALPAFKKNVLQFFQEIIEVAHEKGLLYNYENEQDEEDEENLASPLMNYILTWVTALTTSNIRPLRFTATDILFSIQTQLCKVIKSVETSLERSQRQLTKTKKSNKSKYETLNKTVESCQLQKRTVLEYFNDVCTIVMDKRYRDVDPQIRLICLKNLNEAMMIYPVFFCQGIYLRYFGWLLSDPIGQVRVENTRVLLKLYRSVSADNITLGLRQFSEKYKLQLIKMGQIDNDAQVRIHAYGICCELLKLGFLDDEDSEQIITNYPFESNIKIQQEASKFVSILNDENLSNLKDKYQLFLETYKSDHFADEWEHCLQIKSLIDTVKPMADKPVEVIFQTLSVNYETQWNFLLQYFLSDISSIKFTKEDGESVDNEETEDFKKLVELDEDEKLVLLKFIQGYLQYLGTKKIDEQVSTQLIKLVEYLPQIQKDAIKSSKLFLVFLNTWTLLIKSKESVYSLFNKADKLDQYEEITSEIIKYFKEFEVTEELKQFFAALFDSHGLTSNIKVQIQTMLEELVEEVVKTIDHYNDDIDITDDELTEQRNIIKLVDEVAPVLNKLRDLADFVNVANLANIANLINSLVFKVLRKFDVALVVSQWKHNFLQQLPTFLKSLTSVYDLILVIASWKFERLLETKEEEQHHIAIDLEFDGIVDLVNQTIRLIYESTREPQFVDLKTLLIMKYIDLVLSFKIFYVKFQSNNSFENFQSFFNSNMQLIVIKDEMQKQILDLFLVKEVKLAHILETDLDREDEEDVNFDDYIDKDADQTSLETSMFADEESQTVGSSNNEQVEAVKKEKVWGYEKDLSVHTLKIISLANLSLVSENIIKRVKLNKDKLGNVFEKIIQQQEEHEKQVKESNKNTNVITEVEEEPVQEESSVVENEEQSEVTDTSVPTSSSSNDNPITV
ncbi:psc3 Cohesin subunit psc3 [Candida maltosa Xu316]|uniref:SCD domain-containing protein n=1 Tax=Candida maltosa (strain Xu316) TaxID=1245528 RepID=M3JCT3_CANMX|nr:hypothetical protein G210_5020 [Candida maltosa Xu316]